MIEGKALLDKLYEQPELFEHYIKHKLWPEAKRCYDRTVTVLCFLKADEKLMVEFFGARGERGVILKEGLFKEELVQKAYLEATVKGNGGYENKQYEPWQKNSA